MSTNRIPGYTGGQNRWPADASSTLSNGILMALLYPSVDVNIPRGPGTEMLGEWWGAEVLYRREQARDSKGWIAEILLALALVLLIAAANVSME